MMNTAELFPDLPALNPPEKSSDEPPKRAVPAAKPKAKAVVKAQPAHSPRVLFAPPQLTDPDDLHLYSALLTALEARLRPGEDPTIWIHMGDFAHCEVEVRRLRRAKTTLIALQRDAAGREILEPGFAAALAQPQRYIGDWPVPGLLEAANARNARLGLPAPDSPEFRSSGDEAVRLAEAKLARQGVSPTAIEDQAFLLVIDRVEKIERLLANAVSARNSAQAAFERRADRQHVQSVIEIADGEFE